jgi:hypothetical protein
VKARQDFSIYSSEGHFVQQSRTCRYRAQLGMILITPVKFGCNLTSTFDLWQDKIFLFLALATNLCSEAEHDSNVHN